MERAQRLFDEQLQVYRTDRLQPLADRLTPLHAEIFRNYDTSYYWTCFQCEWASDILFRPGSLQRFEPLLLRHGLGHFSSPDVLRFWGKGTSLERFPDEITTSLKVRVVGDRLKHWMQGNSLKCHGKARTPQSDVFRVETTTSNVDVFRTYRPAEGGPENQLAWRRMRRGMADLHRRTQISQRANERCLDAFAQSTIPPGSRS